MSEFNEIILLELAPISARLELDLIENNRHDALGMAAALLLVGQMSYAALNLDKSPSKKDAETVKEMLGALEKNPQAMTLLLLQLAKFLARAHYSIQGELA